MSNPYLCPRCGVRRFTPYGSGEEANDEAPYPALSRVADVYVCNWCGTHEAFQDLAGSLSPLSEWPVVLPEALLQLVP